MDAIDWDVAAVTSDLFVVKPTEARSTVVRIHFITMDQRHRGFTTGISFVPWEHIVSVTNKYLGSNKSQGFRNSYSHKGVKIGIIALQFTIEP